MFSLIITIVSIALVVALVAATMYHGGDVLTQGRDQADAAAFVAGAQQISGAASMAAALSADAATDTASITALVAADYLANVPDAPGTAVFTLDHADGYVTGDVVSAGVCDALNQAVSSVYVCAAAATDLTGLTGASDINAIRATAGAAGVFVFKY